MFPKFPDIQTVRPDLKRLSREYSRIHELLDEPGAEIKSLISEWDGIRRKTVTWQNLVELNFERNTAHGPFIEEKKKCEELTPHLTELDISLKRKILEGPHRVTLKEWLGESVLALWTSEVMAFQPEIKAELLRESQLSSDYSSLLASAELEFRGGKYNHEGIDQFKFSPDRDERRDAMTVKWDWFSRKAAGLDALFAQLVETRHSMARKLGYADYLELGYLRRCRIDYGKEEVEFYRAQVEKEVVPFCQELIESKRKKLNIAQVRYWDEAVHSASGNPKPQGGHDWMIEQASSLFNEMHHSMGQFFSLLVDHELLDLKNRPQKGGGGFCTDFPEFGLPYIFANFNGTADDVRVFTHEVGHAFQGFCSRSKDIYDYVWPTYESCEIHSMGLEFLTFPFMDRFFGKQAEQFCIEHVIDSILFLPYGVAVDHFQHLVYQSPHASSSERLEMWRQVESKYLPWRNYDGLSRLMDGGRWQLQRHIYMYPLYYIDYTLALACALQFWTRSASDYDGTLQDYVKLCHLGGTLPFGELLTSVGLRSPFEPGTLRECMEFARSFLCPYL